MHALLQSLTSSGCEEPEATAELLVSEAAADLPTFGASSHLRGELRERVEACARARVLHAPAVSFAALDRARGTLEDFARTYLPLHDLNPADIVRFLPELAFVEAMIYAMDEDNERQAARLGPDPSEWCFESETALRGVLHARGLLDDEVGFHLDAGKAYWALERSICRAMLSGERLDEAEVLRAHELKSFDYRLLNCLLYKLAGTTAEPALEQFLRVDEVLTDIADDLYDYEVRENVARASCANSSTRVAARPLPFGQTVTDARATRAQCRMTSCRAALTSTAASYTRTAQNLRPPDLRSASARSRRSTSSDLPCSARLLERPSRDAWGKSLLGRARAHGKYRRPLLTRPRSAKASVARMSWAG